jgi:hypothetical protein
MSHELESIDHIASKNIKKGYRADQEDVNENNNPKQLNKINKAGSNRSSNALTNPDRYGSEKVKETIKEIQDKGGYISDTI